MAWLAFVEERQGERLSMKVIKSYACECGRKRTTSCGGACGGLDTKPERVEMVSNPSDFCALGF